MDWLDAVKWDADGLVPVIAQEAGTGDVLMMAFMNREALERTVALGEVQVQAAELEQAAGADADQAGQLGAVRPGEQLGDVTAGVRPHPGDDECAVHGFSP